MSRERLKKIERQPKFVVVCDNCDFSFTSNSVSMVDKVSMEDITNRHAQMNPEHIVRMFKIELPN